MKIALIIYGSLDTVSGGYLYDRKLVDHLRGNGHLVEVVSLPWRGYMESLKDNFDANLLRRLVTGRFDLILQDELNHPSLFRFNQTLKTEIQTPLVSIVHHLRVDEPWGRFERWRYRQVEKAYLSSVDGFVFNSETTKASVSKLVKTLKPHVVALPAGDRFADVPDIDFNRNSESGKLKLLFVGNLIERKGLELLLNALRQLPAGKWELDVVGDPTIDPEYAGRCRALVESIPRLRTAVRFYGPLDDDQLAIRFSMNHCFVVPSFYEGFGIVYLEAFGFGLPAIATTAGAAGEIITDGQNGFVIPPGDANELAKVLRSLINDRKWLGQMGQKARQTFQEFPTWDESCSKIEQFLLKLGNAL